MAKHHDPQDTVSLRESNSGLGDRSWPVVLGLGVNAWLTHVLHLLLSVGATFMQHVVGSCALVCLAFGIAVRARATGAVAVLLSSWLLLAGFPAMIGAALAFGDEQRREAAHTGWSMVLCAASLVAYGIAAVISCKQPLGALEVETHPVGGVRENRSLRAPRLRGFVIALVVLGAFLLVVVAPLYPPYASLASTWGDAAEAGATLAALVGTATGVSVVAVHLGSMLRRADARRESARQRQTRIATLLIVSLLGWATYLTVSP